MTKKLRAALITDKIMESYPNAVCSLDYNHDYELIIAGRLSAQCTDKRVNMVTPTLFSKYRTLEDFAGAEISAIEEIIKPCGLYKTKAKSIVEMSQQLIVNFGGKLPHTIEELTTLSGIGRKTANLIIGDIFHQPAIVTDTHCIRISHRLGLTENTLPEKVEADLRKLIPPEKSAQFCHCIVYHGREVCKAQNPQCNICPLKNLCLNKNS